MDSMIFGTPQRTRLFFSRLEIILGCRVAERSGCYELAPSRQLLDYSASIQARYVTTIQVGEV